MGVIIAGCALVVGTCSIVVDRRAWVAFERVDFESGVARVHIKNYGNGPALNVTTLVRADSAKPAAPPVTKRDDTAQSVKCGDAWIDDPVAAQLETVVAEARRKDALVEVTHWQQVA